MSLEGTLLAEFGANRGHQRGNACEGFRMLWMDLERFERKIVADRKRCKVDDKSLACKDRNPSRVGGQGFPLDERNAGR